MVLGIDSFRGKFKDYTDYYTIIGGTACDILLTEADLPFRATKDIDMILIMEDNFPEFAAIFWEYIKEGGYKCGWNDCAGAAVDALVRIDYINITGRDCLYRTFVDTCAASYAQIGTNFVSHFFVLFKLCVDGANIKIYLIISKPV